MGALGEAVTARRGREPAFYMTLSTVSGEASRRAIRSTVGGLYAGEIGP